MLPIYLFMYFPLMNLSLHRKKKRQFDLLRHTASHFTTFTSIYFTSYNDIVYILAESLLKFVQK